MPEIVAIKIEEGPGAITPMGFDDTAYVLKAFGTLLEDKVFVGVDSVVGHGGWEVGNLEVQIYGWSHLVDYLMSNSPDSIVDAIEDSGEHEFDTKAEGIELIQNLRDSAKGWGPFITADDELNLVIKT